MVSIDENPKSYDAQRLCISSGLIKRAWSMSVRPKAGGANAKPDLQLLSAVAVAN